MYFGERFSFALKSIPTNLFEAPMQKRADTITPPMDEPVDCASRQTGALLWLLARCVTQRQDPELVLAALQHFDLLAGNPQADPRVRLVCARLAAQWRGRVAGAPPHCAENGPVHRTLH
jgi:hypothetical protein